MTLTASQPASRSTLRSASRNSFFQRWSSSRARARRSSFFRPMRAATVSQPMPRARSSEAWNRGSRSRAAPSGAVMAVPSGGGVVVWECGQRCVRMDINLGPRPVKSNGAEFREFLERLKRDRYFGIPGIRACIRRRMGRTSADEDCGESADGFAVRARVLPVGTAQGTFVGGIAHGVTATLSATCQPPCGSVTDWPRCQFRDRWRGRDPITSSAAEEARRSVRAARGALVG